MIHSHYTFGHRFICLLLTFILCFSVINNLSTSLSKLNESEISPESSADEDGKASEKQTEIKLFIPQHAGGFYLSSVTNLNLINHSFFNFVEHHPEKCVPPPEQA